MASTVGNSLSIDIRVFPPPISCRVTRRVVTGSSVICRAVLVGEAIAENEPMRSLDLIHVPEPAMPIAIGTGHVVLDATTGA
jgi:hypothetical protein